MNISGEKNPNYSHGFALKGKTDPHYWIWSAMIQRCTNKSNKQYADYGARGIFVCERWLKFKNFIEDMGKRPTKNHCIDRINNDDGYYKENCHWASYQKNNLNKRIYKNKTSKYKGVYKRERKGRTYWAWSIRFNGKISSKEGFKSENDAYEALLKYKKENNL